MAVPPTDPLRAMMTAETATLEHLSRASSERVDRVRRATTLLAMAGVPHHRQAARQTGFGSPTAVTRLVTRFNQRRLAVLDIAAGRGRTATYTLADRVQIVATAQ